MPDQTEPQILNKTLGEVLQNNNHAQGMVMKAMQIGPEQFQQLLNMTGSNAASAGIMNMTIGDLFKKGVVGQATAMNQGGQLNNMDPNQTLSQQGVMSVPMMVAGGQTSQVSPEQMQEIMGILQNGQVTQATPVQIENAGSIIAAQSPQSSKPSFFQRLKNLFK